MDKASDYESGDSGSNPGGDDYLSQVKTKKILAVITIEDVLKRNCCDNAIADQIVKKSGFNFVIWNNTVSIGESNGHLSR